MWGDGGRNTADRTAVRTAATGVKTALASVVSAKTSDMRSSSGLAIHLPTSSSDGYLSTYKTDAAAFCAATGWDSFAKWLATGTRSAPAAAAGGESAAPNLRRGVAAARRIG